MRIITFSPYAVSKTQRRLSSFVSRFVTSKLNITQADLDRGTPGSPANCPGALAARRLFPKARLITVGGTTITANFAGHSETWDGGQPLAQFIAAVDGKAFTFYDATGEPIERVDRPVATPRLIDLRLIARQPHTAWDRSYYGDMPQVGSL